MYFHQGMPMGSHAEDDHASFRMQTSMLCDSGACKLVEVELAFGVTAISVKRALKHTGPVVPSRSSSRRARYGKGR